MSGKRWLPEWQRADIVRAVRAARTAGVGWKELEELFDISAKQLRRYLADAVSRETMSQKISEMSHRHGCAKERAA